MTVLACPHCRAPVNCTGLTGMVACPYCKNSFTLVAPSPTTTVTPPLVRTASLRVTDSVPPRVLSPVEPHGKAIHDWQAWLLFWVVTACGALLFVLIALRDHPQFAQFLAQAILIPVGLPLVGLLMWLLGHSMLKQVQDNPGLGCVYGPAAFLVPLISVAIGALVIHVPIGMVSLVGSCLGYRVSKTAFTKTSPVKI